MSARLKSWIGAAAISCTAVFLAVGVLSGEWDAALASAGALFVFLWGFPLMAIASLEDDL